MSTELLGASVHNELSPTADHRQNLIIDYSSISGLEGVYLEDGYVLSILETPGRFDFVLGAVLTSAHPL